MADAVAGLADAVIQLLQAWPPHIRERQQNDAAARANFLRIEFMRLGLQSKMNAPHKAIYQKGELCILHSNLKVDYVHQYVLVDIVYHTIPIQFHKRLRQRSAAMTSKHILALKVAAVLWVIWGLVHMFAGVMVVSQAFKV